MVQFGKFGINLTSNAFSAISAASDGTRARPRDPSRNSRSSYGLNWSSDGPCPYLEERSAPSDGDEPAPPISNTSQQGPSDPSPERVARRPTLLEALRDKTLLAPNQNPDPQNTNSTLRKRHKAIQRQLRYMFIYPLCYLLMWLVPFINHSYFYTKEHNPPFILNSLALVSFCLQCAVDCLIFSIRERPWRYSIAGAPSSRRKQSAGTNSDIGMVDLSARSPGVDLSDPQAGQHLRVERNWWDGEST